MKKSTLMSWLVLFTVIMTLTGCIWPFGWDDEGRGGGHRGGHDHGEYHEGGHHEGGDRR